MSIYKFLYTLLAPLFRLLYRVHVHGAENVPNEGGAVIAPNHTSAMDCVIIAVSAPRRVFYMAKAELFLPVLGAFFRAMGGFPVKRAEGDIGAIKKSISIIEGGDPVCIFPQGTRCPHVELEDTREHLKSGVGLIASKPSAPIVPVYIKTKKNKVALFRRTDVYFGAPVTPSDYGIFSGRTRYADTTAMVFDHICSMKNEEGGN